MEDPIAKLELGLERLAKAGDDPDLLGLALQSVHGALEDHFRAQLAADAHLPADQRAAVLDPKLVQWKDLLDAMQLYRDLSANDREQIWRMNAARTKVAHGGRYTGGRAELERYAGLAQTLIGHTPPKPARPPRPPKPAQAPARLPSDGDSAEIPRAIRAGRTAQPQPLPRSRLGWSVALLALALLFGLASFVALRGVGQTRARSTAVAEPTTALASEAAELSGSPEPTAAPQPRAAVVTAAEGLYLRADHSTNADVVVLIPTGARVTVVGGPVASPDFQWWNVEYAGQSGWCAGAFLRFEQST